MQASDIITAKSGHKYLIHKSLGKPGLFGQAFLASGETDSQEVVIKALRAGRGESDRERVFQEARTLEEVAKVEAKTRLPDYLHPQDKKDNPTVHYAVRLLDESAQDALEPFIVLERATGQNVFDDMVDKVVDWTHEPLDEELVLEIACHFAEALGCVHRAGICYDDMKLDNLFWDNTKRPQSPLRIIDWNVTSKVSERGGVVGDWVRFGARLHELYTGVPIEVDREGMVLGKGAGHAPNWADVPKGIRAIIEKGLAKDYQNDDLFLRDLRREYKQAQLGWSALLTQARVADGQRQVIGVLAPLSRAERLLKQRPSNDKQREANLKECATLRQRAEARQGRISQRTLELARNTFASHEFGLAIESFQRAYNEAGQLDPRPRRWLWLARQASADNTLYQRVRQDLEEAVELLNKVNLSSTHQTALADEGSLTTAQIFLDMASETAPSSQIINWLRTEADVIVAYAKDDLAGALKSLEKLQELFNQYPDIKETYHTLKQQQEVAQRRQEAKQRQEQHWQKAQEEIKQAEEALPQAEKQLKRLSQQQEATTYTESADALAQVVRHYERALNHLSLCLTEDRAKEAQELREDLLEKLNNRSQQLLALDCLSQVPALAQSTSFPQRQKAVQLVKRAKREWSEASVNEQLTAPLEEQIKELEPDYVRLQQLEARFESSHLEELEQARAALNSLAQAGISHPLGTRIEPRYTTLLDAQAQDVLEETQKLFRQATQYINPNLCEQAQQLLAQDLKLDQLSPEGRETILDLRSQIEKRQQALADIRQRLEEAEQKELNEQLRVLSFIIQKYAGDEALLSPLLARQEALLGQLSGRVEELESELKTVQALVTALTAGQEGAGQVSAFEKDLGARRNVWDQFFLQLPLDVQEMFASQVNDVFNATRLVIEKRVKRENARRKKIQQALASISHYLTSGELEKADKEYLALAGDILDSDEQERYQQLGDTLKQAKQDADVRNFIEEARIALKKGDDADADMYVQKAAAIDPSHQEGYVFKVELDRYAKMLVAYRALRQALNDQSASIEYATLNDFLEEKPPFDIDKNYFDPKFRLRTTQHTAQKEGKRLARLLSSAQDSWKRGSWQQANNQLAELLERCPSFPKAKELQTKWASDKSRVGQVKKLLEQFKMALENERIEEALECYGQITALSPDQAERCRQELAEKQTALLNQRNNFEKQLTTVKAEHDSFETQLSTLEAEKNSLNGLMIKLQEKFKLLTNKGGQSSDLTQLYAQEPEWVGIFENFLEAWTNGNAAAAESGFKKLGSISSNQNIVRLVTDFWKELQKIAQELGEHAKEQKEAGNYEEALVAFALAVRLSNDPTLKQLQQEVEELIKKFKQGQTQLVVIESFIDGFMEALIAFGSVVQFSNDSAVELLRQKWERAEEGIAEHATKDFINAFVEELKGVFNELRKPFAHQNSRSEPNKKREKGMARIRAWFSAFFLGNKQAATSRLLVSPEFKREKIIETVQKIVHIYQKMLSEAKTKIEAYPESHPKAKPALEKVNSLWQISTQITYFVKKLYSTDKEGFDKVAAELEVLLEREGSPVKLPRLYARIKALRTIKGVKER